MCLRAEGTRAAPSLGDRSWQRRASDRMANDDNAFQPICERVDIVGNGQYSSNLWQLTTVRQ